MRLVVSHDIALVCGIVVGLGTSLVVAFICGAASDCSATRREVLQMFCRQDCGSMMLCTGMDGFMDGNGGVHDFRSDGLLVDDRLDFLMDVMMGMFAFDGWCGRCGVLGFMHGGSVLELSRLLLNCASGVIVILM